MSRSNFARANLTSENSQTAKLSQHEKKPHQSDANPWAQLHTEKTTQLERDRMAPVASLSQAHISPTSLTCVEAGFIVFLLEDALGLRVESEP
jgi:hypothetical protein